MATVEQPERKAREWATFEEFSNCVRVVKELVSSGDAILAVRRGFRDYVRLVIFEGVLGDRVREAPVPAEKCRAIINREVMPLLSSRLASMPESMWLSMLFDAEGAEESVKSAFRAKADLVEQELVDEQLRRAHLFKERTKSDTMSDCEWEIKIKRGDNEGDSPPLPHVTLRFELVDAGSPLSWPWPLPGATKAVVFDCDLADLRDIIRRLEDAADKLGEVPTAEGNQS